LSRWAATGWVEGKGKTPEAKSSDGKRDFFLVAKSGRGAVYAGLFDQIFEFAEQLIEMGKAYFAICRRGTTISRVAGQAGMDSPFGTTPEKLSFPEMKAGSFRMK